MHEYSGVIKFTPDIPASPAVCPVMTVSDIRTITAIAISALDVMSSDLNFLTPRESERIITPPIASLRQYHNLHQ